MLSSASSNRSALTGLAAQAAGPILAGCEYSGLVQSSAQTMVTR
jgi:hypothetical protein